MKKLFPILLTTLALISCEKEADIDRLDNEYMVFTNHDTNAQFNDCNTFYLPDSILIIGDKKDPEYWKDEKARTLIDTFVSQMNASGYTRTSEKGNADLGLQISYITSTYYFQEYYNDGPWWGYYPGYWYPGYWGGNWGGGWYYPYSIVYRYSTGALLADMVNLKHAPEGQKENLTVVWNAYISGLTGSGNSLNLNRTITAIDQAFTQSPYLKKTSEN